MAGSLAWTFVMVSAAVLLTALAVRVLPFGPAAPLHVHTAAARTVAATALLAVLLSVLVRDPAIVAIVAGAVFAVRAASHAGADLRIALWAIVGGAVVAAGLAAPSGLEQALRHVPLAVLAGGLATVALAEYLTAGARWIWHAMQRARAPPRPARPPRPQGAHGAQSRRPPQNGPPGPGGA